MITISKSQIELLRRLACFCLVIVAGSFFAIPTMAQSGRNHLVQLEIVSSTDGPVGQNQKWLEVLSEVGADTVRMSQTSGNARSDVIKTETARGNSYRIIGILTSRNQLLLPGGKYSINDTAQIRAYIASIRADGAEIALAEKMAFGLTAEQLVMVHVLLKPVYEETTIGKSPLDILNKVRESSVVPFEISAQAATALGGDYVLTDELMGLSYGTSLAAAIRPLGLVIMPHRDQGEDMKIIIADSRAAEEFWPIGWPLEVRKDKAIPKLFERIPVNIRNYTFKATLDAIQKSLETPFLYDRNSMAAAGVDMEEIRVNVESKELSYQLILNRVVSQARPRMKMEVRADENGKPFMWFSAR